MERSTVCRINTQSSFESRCILVLSFCHSDYKCNYESYVGKREKKQKLKLKVQPFGVSFRRLNQFYWNHR